MMIHVVMAVIQVSLAQAVLPFELDDAGSDGANAPAITPWRVIELDPDYGGMWLVAGDVDGDGAVEIVSAENSNEGDVHYTSAVVAQELDGTVLWRWGDAAAGRKIWHHDVACQIHDWDADGHAEVVLATKGAVVALDGATGAEERRIAIAEDATDCVVFCSLTGPGRRDILVKDRYRRIWAYSPDGTLLWETKDPGGYRTAHQPRPMDIDGDGLDEIMAGYAMLNSDGAVRWVYESKAVDQKRGHLDCARVLEAAAKPEDFRIVLTCCGANNIACIDGNGAVVWEKPGAHFESIQVGTVVPGAPTPQILVDIDHAPLGKSPVWVLDKDGTKLGEINADYSRHHRLVDWNGDGLDEIIIGGSRGLYDGTGTRIGTFVLSAPKPGEPEGFEMSVLLGDMTGDGVPDAVFITPGHAYIFKNEKGRKPTPPWPLGMGLNVTLY